MKVLFDTNIWIRYIIRDNEKHFDEVTCLIRTNEEGLIQIYSSSIIFLEISYVLKNIYHFKFEEILEVLHTIMQTKGITIIQDTDIELALSYFEKYKVKFTDCLIASQLQLKEEIILITFDRELKKVKEVVTQTPREILLSIRN